jgi:hypothetical protein
MSNDLITTFQNALSPEIRAKMQEQVAADLARLGSTGGKDTIRITQDKKFQFPDDTQADGPLNLIIVDFVYRNEYYPDAFNRKEMSPPTCFAVSPEQVSLVPTPNSPKRQAEKCSACQWDKFNSAPSGEGKACKNTVFLAVLPPDATEDSPLFVVKTSPTAITPFNNYVAKVGRTVQLALWAVTTKLFFEPGVTYASLRFDLSGPNPIADQTMRRREEARHRLLQEPDFAAIMAAK